MNGRERRSVRVAAGSRMLVLLGALFALLSAGPAAAAPAPAAGVAVIGPDQAGWIDATFRTVVLPADCVLGDIAIDRGVARTAVRCGASESQPVVLQHRDEAGEGLRTAKFLITAPSEDLRQRVATAVGAREASWTWRTMQAKPVVQEAAGHAPAKPRRLARLPDWLVPLLLPAMVGCLLLGLLATVLRARVWLQPWLSRRWGPAALGTLIAVGGWLRLFVAPHTPLNQADWTRLPFREQPFWSAPWLQVDVLAAQVVDWLAMQLLGCSDMEAAAVAHAVVGALSVAFVGGLVGRVTRSALAMVLASSLWAALPLLVRFTASTNSVALLLCFGVAAVCTAIAAAEEDDRLLMVGAAAWTVSAALCHGMARLLGVVVAFALVAWTPRVRRWRWQTWWPLVAAGALLLPLLLLIALDVPPPTSDGQVARLGVKLQAFRAHSFEPRWIGVTVCAAACAGLVAAWRHGQRAAVGLWILWLVSVWGAFAAGGQTDNNAVFGNARYLIGLWPPLLGAVSHTALWWEASRRSRWLLGVGLFALLTDLAVRQGVHTYTGEWNEQQQTQFIAELAGKMEPQSTVWIPPPAVACCPQQQVALARQLLSLEPHLTVHVSAQDGSGWQPSGPAEGDLLLVGMPCWSNLDAVPRRAGACAQVFDAWEVMPLHSRTFANAPYYMTDMAAWQRFQRDPTRVDGQITLGLYRLLRRRTP